MNMQRNGILSLVGTLIMNAIVVLPAGGDVTDIVEIDSLPTNSIYSKIWQPFIAKWTNEHYVASYGLQLRDKGDMGDLVCSISKDRGKTWSPPIMIFDHRIPNGSVRYAYNNSVLFRPAGARHFVVLCDADTDALPRQRRCAAVCGLLRRWRSFMDTC